MKVAVFASLIASTAAFAPAEQGRASTSLNEFVRGYAGNDSVEPLFIGKTGSANFDPAGLAEVRESTLYLEFCHFIGISAPPPCCSPHTIVFILFALALARTPMFLVVIR